MVKVLKVTGLTALDIAGEMQIYVKLKMRDAKMKHETKVGGEAPGFFIRCPPQPPRHAETSCTKGISGGYFEAPAMGSVST